MNYPINQFLQAELTRAAEFGWTPVSVQGNTAILESRRPVPTPLWLLLSLGSWLVLLLRRQILGNLRMKMWTDPDNNVRWEVLNPDKDTIWWAVLGLMLTIALIFLI